MRHTRTIWLVFALALGVAAGGMGWLTHTALQLDRQEAAARKLAEEEELVRLALWRMDAVLVGVMVQEGARPHFHYQSFFATDEAFDVNFDRVGGGTVMIPSPLLRPDSPLVKLHFRAEPAGTITSPQVPTGDLGKAAEPYVSSEPARRMRQRLEELRKILRPAELVVALPNPPPPSPTTQPLNEFFANANPKATRGDRYRRNGREFTLRQQVMQGQNVAVNNSLNYFNSWNGRVRGARDGEPAGLWCGDALIVARRVAFGDDNLVVGCWLDWPAVRTQLLEAVRDLLPGADLLPAPKGGSKDKSRLLAALPLRLEPGPMPPVEPSGWSPIMIALATAWGGLALGALAVGILLAGALAMSRRRGAFVSAVTHELRTPLTTMRMYTEMLVDGRVADADKVHAYLATIHAETNRLCRLVENVLAHSRLEGRRQPLQPERVALDDLLDRTRDRLTERAVASGMELIIEPAGDAAVRADPTALEQMLFNLVDNACKYAAGADDTRIHISCLSQGARVLIRVRDHGPGVPASEAGLIFRPFHRARRDQAGSHGGVGLGLSISRRIARGMGGDLLVEDPDGDGACFAIRLPVWRGPNDPK